MMRQVVAGDDAFNLGVLSRAGAFMGVARGRLAGRRKRSAVHQVATHSIPSLFPPPNDLQKHRIRALAEDLDAHRKRVLAEHPHLTMTGLYNVLESLRAGVAPDALDEAERRIFDDGLVLILKEFHEKLDAAVADAYGWPVDLADEEILAKLVALNRERAQEEARGEIRWLRPDYQIPRFGSAKEKAELDLVGGRMGVEAPAAAGPRPTFPTDDFAQTAAVMSVLATATTRSTRRDRHDIQAGPQDRAQGRRGSRRARQDRLCHDARRRGLIRLAARRLVNPRPDARQEMAAVDPKPPFGRWSRPCTVS